MKNPLSVDFTSVQYSDIISALQDGQSLAKTLHLRGKVGNIFQRFRYRIILEIILALIRRHHQCYGCLYEYRFSDSVRDSIICVFSRLGPANYRGKDIDSACQIYADGLTFREQMRVFGMTLFKIEDRQLIVPIDLIGYEFLSKYISILEKAGIKLIPLISDSSIDSLNEEDKPNAIIIRDLLADECLLVIANREEYGSAVTLCYDLDEYSINPSPAIVEQEESLLQAFASVPKIDISMQLADERRFWYDFRHHYLIDYANRQA